MYMKKTSTLIAIGIIIVAVALYFWTLGPSTKKPVTAVPPATTATSGDTRASAPQKKEDKTRTVIGTSVEKRAITAYHFGTGTKELLFVGGIHGGYEWNTTLVAYELMEYLKAHPSALPSKVTVTVIPVANPDGLAKVISISGPFVAAQVTASKEVQVSGRFNANNVDLNRNFDCAWQEKATWQSTPVSGGLRAFSEPESEALKQYVETHSPAAVVVWFSSAGGVYASSCGSVILPETKVINSLYAKASEYPAYNTFDAYETTGDMPNWISKNKIPAISVLLTNHQDIEWSKNWAGISALLAHYGK